MPTPPPRSSARPTRRSIAPRMPAATGWPESLCYSGLMSLDERARVPADISIPEMERLLSLALSRGGEFADLYFEHHRTSSLLLEESIIRTASTGVTCGLGVRVVSGERTGYAYTDDLSWKAMAHAAETAAHIAAGTRTLPPQPVSPAPVERRYGGSTLAGVGLPERIAL